MPKEQLPDFDDIVAVEFSIGGDPNKLMAVSDTWGEEVKVIESEAYALSDKRGLYEIFEPFDEHAELQARAKELAQQFADLAQIYKRVSDSIYSYFMNYGRAFLAMKDLAELDPFDDYEALVAAIDDYNAAEAAVLTAKKNIEDNMLSLTSEKKAVLEQALVTAELEEQQAEERYQARLQAWNKQLEKGKRVKDRLAEDVELMVKLIKKAGKEYGY